MKMKRFFLVIILGVFLSTAGCRTTQPVSNQEREEDKAAIKSVLGTMAGQEVDDKDLKDLSHQVKTDEEAKSAVEAISGSMSPGSAAMVCPNDGKRYSARLKTCPDGVTPLEPIQD